MRFIPYVLLSLVLLGCGDDDYPVRLETHQVGRLLMQNNSKAWLLETEVSCKVDDTLTFYKAVDAKSLPKYVYAKGEILCPDESADDVSGTWELVGTADLNQLRLREAETTTYEIISITASKLHLRTAGSDLILRAL